MTEVRKGQAPGKLSREQFHEHLRQSYIDSAFGAECDAIEHLEQIAWNNYNVSRKSPVTRKAGPEFARPGLRPIGGVLHLGLAARDGLDRSWHAARPDRFIGHYRPYATSHDDLNRDQPIQQEEVRNVARAVVNAVGELRDGRRYAPAAILAQPRSR